MNRDTAYLERRGASYSWRIMPVDAVVIETSSTALDDPDVWMCLSASWPTGSGTGARVLR
jgi:hypothetical protein